MQGAQKQGSEAHLQVRRNDEVAAQSRSERDRWTFYETIIFNCFFGFSAPVSPLVLKETD
jgi:hypothetical protein